MDEIILDEKVLESETEDFITSMETSSISDIEVLEIGEEVKEVGLDIVIEDESEQKETYLEDDKNYETEFETEALVCEEEILQSEVAEIVTAAQDETEKMSEAVTDPVEVESETEEIFVGEAQDADTLSVESMIEILEEDRQEEVLFNVDSEVVSLEFEKESEFSFINVLSEEKETEVIKVGDLEYNTADKTEKEIENANTISNTLYNLDDIYNLLAGRLPEVTEIERFSSNQHNLDDIYDILYSISTSNNASGEDIELLSVEPQALEIVDDDLPLETIVEDETEASLSDILEESRKQSKLMSDIIDLQTAVVRNQKIISDNENRVNGYIVGGIFAIFGAIVISNLFRGIR